MKPILSLVLAAALLAGCAGGAVSPKAGGPAEPGGKEAVTMSRTLAEPVYPAACHA